MIDTSDLTPGQLRAWIRDLIQADVAPLVLTFESFAYKRGVPRDADLMFDVRCLPNPYYDRDLRPPGRDEPVAQWLAGFDQVGQMVDDIAGFIQRWLPQYAGHAQLPDRGHRLYRRPAPLGLRGRTAGASPTDHPLLVRHRNQLPDESA